MTPALRAGSTVAVVGAAGSGKTLLARALSPRLAGLAVRVLDDPPITAAEPPGHACILLMRLDLPPSPALDAEGRRRREQADAQLRATLAAAALPFAVIHGRGDERLACALRALGLARAARPGRLAAWDCDKCSDPACEHRLFTDLLRRRADAGNVP